MARNPATGGQSLLIRVDDAQLKQIDALLEEFPKTAPRAIMRAINHTAAKANTVTLKAITSHINIKRQDIAATKSGKAPHSFGAVRVRKATTTRLQATVQVTGKKIPLIWFRARQLKGKRVKLTNVATRKTSRRRMAGGGVRYKILKSGAAKTIPSAFLGQGRINRGKRTGEHSGHTGVFRRRGRARLPIMQLFGPSIPHVAEQSPTLKRALDVDMTKSLSARIDHEIGRLLAKQGAR